MKVLAQKLVILTAALSVLLGLFVLCPWPQGEAFCTILKKHAFLRKTTGRKIVLVGGSGVFNSLSAKVMEREVPGYRAVNMGVNAGLGLQFNVNEIRDDLYPGDLVVLSPEYSNFEGQCQGSVQVLKAVNVAPFTFRYVEREQFYRLLRKEWLSLLQMKAQSYFNGLASALSNSSVQIDERGDLVSRTATRDVSGMDFTFTDDPSSYRACVAVLNDFAAYCNNRGVRVVLSFPSLPTPQYKKVESQLGRLYEKLRKDTAVTLLHPPAENVFDPTYFDDTVYHLGPRGREIRSQHLARLINSKVLGPAGSGAATSTLPVSVTGTNELTH